MSFSVADSSYLQEPIAAGILEQDTVVKGTHTLCHRNRQLYTNYI